MRNKAPRQPLRLWVRRIRGAGMATGLWLAAQAAVACEARYDTYGLSGRSAESAFSNRTETGRHEFWAARSADLRLFAAYVVKTSEYNHGVLGNLQDAKALTIHAYQPGDTRITCPVEVTLPAGHVFEDVRPHITDVDGDGRPEVIAVHSSLDAGARLEVYSRSAELLAATPPIGQRNRWLAVIGAADLDGDGHVEIAYIDRPHLAKTLRIWRFKAGQLQEVTAQTGLTNHRIGEDFISSGLRDCGQGPEIVTADAGWQSLIASRLQDGQIHSRAIGAFTGPDSLTAALECR
jgi:hypothetical protein